MITDIGLQCIASHLASANPNKTLTTHVALSENTDEVGEGDITVEDEEYRVATEVSANNITCLNEKLIVGSDIDTDGINLNKVGLLDQSVGGNLICKSKLNLTLSIGISQKLHIVYGIVARRF